MQLEGIHHISAITRDAARNVDFYTRVLGLRMVAKTVNQDDPSVYHLFYGDEQAHPGADLTFFEYPSAAPGRAGAGMVHRIVWRVGSSEALDFWGQRLGVNEIVVDPGERCLRFADPEGLAHELVLSSAPDRALVADHPEVPSEHALRGFEGVRAYSADPPASVAVLEGLMGAERSSQDTWELRGERRGGWIALDPAPARVGHQGAGVVHHIAWSTTDAELPAWIETVGQAGVPNSGFVDRHFFHSLYFREPGGVLYELATEEPGFTVDGPVEQLGRELVLPPFLESRRAQIEGRLTPIGDPRPAGVARAARA